MNFYRDLINRQAMQSLEKTVYTPDARLGIGTGEELAPLPNIVEYPNPLKNSVMPDLNSASIEQATIDGYAEPVNVKDFPMTLFYGNSIEGV